MEKAISVGQLIISSLFLFAAIVGIYISLRINDAEHNERLQRLQDENRELKQELREYKGTTDKKFDEIMKGITAVQLELKDKQDKK